LALPFQIKKASEIDLAGLSRLQNSTERKLRALFAAATEQMRSKPAVNNLARLIQNGSFEGAISATVEPYLSMADGMVEAYVKAGRTLAGDISSQLGRQLSFDVTTPAVTESLRAMRTAFADKLALAAADTARDVLLTGLRDGAMERGLAQRLAESVGLSVKDYKTVANYRALLENNDKDALRRALRDRRFDPALASGRNLEPKSIARMVGRYRDRLLGSRGKYMGRYFGLSAINQGRDALLNQLYGGGIFDGAERTWYTAADEKVRDSHAAMSGQVRGLNEPFISGSGEQLMYPGDPDASAAETANCRCGLAITVRQGG